MLRRIISKLQHGPVSDRIYSLERENQALRLELAEVQARLESLLKTLDQERQSANRRSQETAFEQMSSLIKGIAAPLDQLHTQCYLNDTQGRQLKPQDVLAVTRNLLRTLQNHGLTWVEELGSEVLYDPDRHNLIGTGASPVPSQNVVVRFAGISYQGRILQKAGIVPKSQE